MSALDAATTDPSRIGLRADRILEVLRAATLGEYDVASELGRGGMAVVYLAHDLQLNRKVAIKALLPELLFAEDMDRRFKQEARVAAKLDHPNILVVYSVRESKDLLYIVMKLVDGLPLSTIIRRNGALPISVVKFVIRQIADALHYAHGEGVIHRDMKPANVMVDRKGNLVVMDFGIAKAVDEANLTHTGLVIGTPAYMSPEQCLSQRVTFAADQYSLGTVAYELLTGTTPFTGSALEMQWAHAKEVPASVRSRRLDCPPELDALVLRMLAKKPDDRWTTLEPIIDALAQDAQSESHARQFLQALVAGRPGDPVRSLPTTPVSPVPRASSSTPDVARESSPREEIPPAPPPLAISITTPRLELEEAETADLHVVVDSGEEIEATWATSHPGIARVSNTGTVTAVAAGVAEITAAVDSSRARCDVHVAAPRAATVAIDPNEATLRVGETMALTVAAASRTGRNVAKAARFKSLDRRIARVTDSGAVTAHGVGTTSVVATLDGVEASVRIVVVPVPVAGIRVEPPTISLALGKKIKVSAKPHDAAGTVLDGRLIEWTARDRAIVTIDAGRLVAVGAGSTAIDVTCEGMRVEVPVTVAAPPPPVVKAPKPERSRPRPIGRLVGAAIVLVGVVVGGLVVRERLRDESEPVEQPQQPNDTTRQISTGTDSVVLPTTTGVITPPSRIDTSAKTPVVPAPTKRDSTPTASNAVPARVVAASIEVSPTALPDLEPGDSARIVPRVMGSDGRPMNDARVSWQTSGSQVVAVSSGGWIRAISPGTATIVAVTGGIRRSAQVVVVPPLPRRVTLGPGADRVKVGESIQLRATVADKRQAPIVGARIAWRSLQPDVATVDERGNVAGQRGGRAAIVASAGAVADTVSIDVEARVAVVTPPENRDSATRLPAPPAPKDSADAPKPVLTQAAAEPLFRELASAITARSNARIMSVYSEGGTAADARLQRDFLKFVGDAEPRCAVRTVTVGPTRPDGSAVTAAIGCAWRNNAGIPKDGVASFSGTAVSSGTGWALKDVRLAAKFW